MGNRQQRSGGEPNTPLRVVRSIHRKTGFHLGRGWVPSRPSTASCALIAILLAPDLCGLVPAEWSMTFGGQAMQARWVVWLVLTQLSLSALCIFAIRAKVTYGVQVRLAGCALWYVLQALDEAIAGNLWATQWIEYPALMVGIFGVHLYLRKYDRTGK